MLFDSQVNLIMIQCILFYKNLMLNLFLLLSMIACINGQAILSMLLFLILTYLAAAFWLISQELIYAGLLYVLVYVGAIVVLFVYVIQLVDTVQFDFNFTSDEDTKTNSLVFFDLLIGTLIFIIAVSILSNFNLSLSSSANSVYNHQSLIEGSLSNVDSFSLLLQKAGSSLDILAQDLFNSYGFVLMLTVTAIILAIVGPVNLALQSNE